MGRRGGGGHGAGRGTQEGADPDERHGRLALSVRRGHQALILPGVRRRLPGAVSLPFSAIKYQNREGMRTAASSI